MLCKFEKHLFVLQINFCHSKHHWMLATLTRFQKSVASIWRCCLLHWRVSK